MVKKIIHRWKAEIELYQLGYVPTPTLYVTFRSRRLFPLGSPLPLKSMVRKNRKNKARDLQFFLYNHVLLLLYSRKIQPSSIFRGGYMRVATFRCGVKMDANVKVVQLKPAK